MRGGDGAVVDLLAFAAEDAVGDVADHFFEEEAEVAAGGVVGGGDVLDALGVNREVQEPLKRLRSPVGREGRTENRAGEGDRMGGFLSGCRVSPVGEMGPKSEISVVFHENDGFT